MAADWWHVAGALTRPAPRSRPTLSPHQLEKPIKGRLAQMKPFKFALVALFGLAGAGLASAQTATTIRITGSTADLRSSCHAPI